MTSPELPTQAYTLLCLDLQDSGDANWLPRGLQLNAPFRSREAAAYSSVGVKTSAQISETEVGVGALNPCTSTFAGRDRIVP